MIFLSEQEDNPIKRMKILEDGLEFEKNRLTKEKYFTKDNIGHFYQIFETRPYIRGLSCKLDYLIIDGKMKQAIERCKEILHLNENDNLGVRYLLMGIYAFFEDEKELLNLYKKYPEECLEMLMPLFILYYKNGDNKMANKYLDRIQKSNPHFIKYFKGTIKLNKNIPYRHYSKGDSSEVIMYFNEYDYLLDTVPTIKYYILENCKEK